MITSPEPLTEPSLVSVTIYLNLILTTVWYPLSLILKCGHYTTLRKLQKAPASRKNNLHVSDNWSLNQVSKSTIHTFLLSPSYGYKYKFIDFALTSSARVSRRVCILKLKQLLKECLIVYKCQFTWSSLTLLCSLKLK